MNSYTETLQALFGLFIIALAGVGCYQLYTEMPKPNEHKQAGIVIAYQSIANPALQFDCKKVSHDIIRCKNWEILCYGRNVEGQLTFDYCMELNKPKQLRWLASGSKK